MYDERCCIKTCCFDIVIGIVAALFTFALGLVLGVFYAATLTEFIASIVVFLVVMAVMLVVLLILRRCRRGKGEGCLER